MVGGNKINKPFSGLLVCGLKMSLRNVVPWSPPCLFCDWNYRNMRCPKAPRSKIRDPWLNNKIQIPVNNKMCFVHNNSTYTPLKFVCFQELLCCLPGLPGERKLVLRICICFSLSVTFSNLPITCRAKLTPRSDLSKNWTWNSVRRNTGGPSSIYEQLFICWPLHCYVTRVICIFIRICMGSDLNKNSLTLFESTQIR